MRLIETLKGAYRGVFEKGKVVKIDRKPLHLTFPDAKKDFSSGAYGATGFDLANAFGQKVVQMGDLLQIVTEDSTDPENPIYDTRKVIYLEPESALLGGRGYHRLWEEDARAGIDLPSITTQGAIVSWRKVGTASREEIEEIEKIAKAGEDFSRDRTKNHLTFPTY